MLEYCGLVRALAEFEEEGLSLAVGRVNCWDPLALLGVFLSRTVRTIKWKQLDERSHSIPLEVNSFLKRSL